MSQPRQAHQALLAPLLSGTAVLSPFFQRDFTPPLQQGTRFAPCSSKIWFFYSDSGVLHQINVRSRMTRRLTTWSSCTSYTQQSYPAVELQNYPCFGWGAQILQGIIPTLQILTPVLPISNPTVCKWRISGQSRWDFPHEPLSLCFWDFLVTSNGKPAPHP